MNMRVFKKVNYLRIYTKITVFVRMNGKSNIRSKVISYFPISVEGQRTVFI